MQITDSAPDPIRNLLLWSLLGFLCFLPCFYAGYTPTLSLHDTSGNILGRDFINIWLSGKLAAESRLELLAQPEIYFDYLTEQVGLISTTYRWSYPPHALLMTYGFGQLPYLAALGLWLTLTAALYLFFSRPIFTSTETPKLWWLLLLTSPAAIINLCSGQNGFLTAGLMLGGFMLAPKRPWLAGFLFACLTFKPHLGVLIPFILLVEKRWTVILSASLFTLGFIGLSLLAFGTQPWIDFLTIIVPHQQWLLMNPKEEYYQYMLPGLHMTLFKAGLPPHLAYAIHWIIAIPTAIASVLAFRRQLDRPTGFLILALATIILTPYGFIYDYTAITAGLAWYVISRPQSEIAKHTEWLIHLVWIAPLSIFFLFPLVQLREFHLLIAALPTLALLLVLLRQTTKNTPDASIA